MYRKISQMQNVFEIYSKKLKKMGLIQPSALDELLVSYGNILDEGMKSAKNVTAISNSKWFDSPINFGI